MRITFLGTGTSQGVPAIGLEDKVSDSKDLKDKRLRCSAMISWDNININIDCSPDFRGQMLSNNVKHLEAILFTHEHADHTAGLDDIRPFVYMQGDMPIYAEKRVLDQLKQRFEYIFATENRYPGAPSVLPTQIDEHSEFNLYGKRVTPLRVMHGQLPILGYRIEDITYITDMKTISSCQLAKIYKTKTLVVNALRKEPHPTHMCLEETLNFIKEVKPMQSFLIHISQKMGLHKEVQKELPKNIYLAYDNLSVEV